MAEWECELVVRRAGARDAVIEVSHSLVRTIATTVADDIANVEFLSALAFHPSVSVRAEVARRDHLDCDAVDHLLADREPTVRQSIIWSSAARLQITPAWALAAIDGDATIAEDLVREIDAFSELDPPALLASLADHRDPVVRTAVARSREGGRKLLRRLHRDEDAEVREAAAETLDNW